MVWNCLNVFFFRVGLIGFRVWGGVEFIGRRF